MCKNRKVEIRNPKFKEQISTCAGFWLLAIAALAVSVAVAEPLLAQQQKKPLPPRPLPAAIVAAWQKADALVGWQELTSDGDIEGDSS